jgi:hypothetical protein
MAAKTVTWNKKKKQQEDVPEENITVPAHKERWHAPAPSDDAPTMVTVADLQLRGSSLSTARVSLSERIRGVDVCTNLPHVRLLFARYVDDHGPCCLLLSTKEIASFYTQGIGSRVSYDWLVNGLAENTIFISDRVCEGEQVLAVDMSVLIRRDDRGRVSFLATESLLAQIPWVTHLVIAPPMIDKTELVLSQGLAQFRYLQGLEVLSISCTADSNVDAWIPQRSKEVAQLLLSAAPTLRVVEIPMIIQSTHKAANYSIGTAIAGMPNLSHLDLSGSDDSGGGLMKAFTEAATSRDRGKFQSIDMSGFIFGPDVVTGMRYVAHIPSVTLRGAFPVMGRSDQLSEFCGGPVELDLTDLHELRENQYAPRFVSRNLVRLRVGTTDPSNTYRDIDPEQWTTMFNGNACLRRMYVYNLLNEDGIAALTEVMNSSARCDGPKLCKLVFGRGDITAADDPDSDLAKLFKAAEMTKFEFRYGTEPGHCPY